MTVGHFSTQNNDLAAVEYLDYFEYKDTEAIFLHVKHEEKYPIEI